MTKGEAMQFVIRSTVVSSRKWARIVKLKDLPDGCTEKDLEKVKAALNEWADKLEKKILVHPPAPEQPKEPECSHTDTAGGRCLNCGKDLALEEIEQEQKP